MSIILDANKNMINSKQRENESLQEYTKRFKTSLDVMESHIGGPIELTKYIGKMKEYNPMDHDSFEKCKWKAYQQFIAFLHMENADKLKYGSLLTGLQTQISLGNNQYPQSITEANNVLSNHKFDIGNRAKNQAIKRETVNENSTEETPEMSFSQLEGKCYCCGKVGHKLPNCQWKDKPKTEWVINK